MLDLSDYLNDLNVMHKAEELAMIGPEYKETTK